MSAFMLSLIAVFVTSIGARDQLLVATLSERLNRNVGLLVFGSLSAIVTAMVMAFAGPYVASFLPGDAKTMLVAIALVLAAIELAWPIRAPKLEEPTRSLGAIAFVLVFKQWSDAARFLVFAFAAWTSEPWFAGIGGALGGIAAIALGWSMGAELTRRIPVRAIRIVLALFTVCLAAYIGLSARDLLG